MDFYVPASEAHKKCERNKARELRKSHWWKQQLQMGTCYYCELKFQQEDLTMDHKVPIARGGKTTKGNVVVACKACNTKKKHLTPAEQLLNSL